MLIEVAIGDAYGAGFEFVEDDIIEKHNKLESYYESRTDDIRAGQYTDDTQMSIAIAELLISKSKFNEIEIAQKFIDVFNRDKRHGYAKGFYNFLLNIEDAQSFINKINPESVRNGAAMRSVPLSYIKDKEELKKKAKLQAQLTHDTHEGIVSSQAVALIGHYFLYEKMKKEKLRDQLLLDTDEMFIINKKDRVMCEAIDTIDAVLTVLINSSTYSEILLKSVDLGGDTDSVASMALGLASLSEEFKNDLPKFLYNDLENKKYGKDYIINLDEKLKKIYDK
jgi:ADP-ribosyl-[dinitrogen reductase] hydrolase